MSAIDDIRAGMVALQGELAAAVTALGSEATNLSAALAANNMAGVKAAADAIVGHVASLVIAGTSTAGTTPAATTTNAPVSSPPSIAAAAHTPADGATAGPPPPPPSPKPKIVV